MNPQLSSKAQWGGINKLITPGSHKKHVDSNQSGSEVLTDHLQIATEANAYYANFAHETTRNLIPPCCPIHFIKDRQPQPTSSLYLHTTKQTEVKQTIKKLKNALLGIDKVSTHILQVSCDYI